jgi:hypothetical protein
MTSAVLDLPPQREALTLLGLPAEQSAQRELNSFAIDGVRRHIASLRTALVMDLLDTRTRDEFQQAFQSSFPNYVRLLRSFSELAATMPPQRMARLSLESLDELEADIRSHGEESFGPSMTERALFTVWTLRKITRLFNSIVTSEGEVAGADRALDHDFATHFLVHALISRFCVDCLIVAMVHNRSVYPEVLAAIDDHLRSVVDAYAWIRQAADLRTPAKIRDADSAPPLDDEEKQLLNESMTDVALGEP